MNGKIILLNGTSSAGKTTLAHALQERFSDAWLHVALDQFRDGLPAKYRGLNAPEGSTGELGLNVVPVAASHTEIRFGRQGKKMLRGMRRAIRALVECGNNVIIDDVILEPEFLDDYLQVFTGLEVIFVGVKCPIDVISQREAARPGRFPGTALGHFKVCHAHERYDVVVDTSVQSPGACAAQVEKFLEEETAQAFTEVRDARRAG